MLYDEDDESLKDLYLMMGSGCLILVGLAAITILIGFLALG